MEETDYLKAHETIRRKFKHLPLIDSLTEKDQFSVLHASRVRRFETGELLTEEGEYDHWVYILIQGGVEVLKSGQHLAEIKGTGEIVGELCLVDHQPRSATVRAMQRTLCLAIDTRLLGEIDAQRREAFYALLYRILAELISARLRASNEENIRLQRELDSLRNKPDSAGR